MRVAVTPNAEAALLPLRHGTGGASMLLDASALRSWLLHDSGSTGLPWLLKRMTDVALAAMLLLLALPVLALAVLLVRLTSPGPAFFTQRRVGYGGQPFTIYKLRTMSHGAPDLHTATLTAAADLTFFKRQDDPRITRIGRILRRTSVDELPQLLNVLRGDMSLVGPRPISPAEAEKLVWARDRRRFAVVPGITGLWQVSGRSLCSDSERLELDRRYVEDWSLLLDLKILLRTVPVVLTARGAV